jgi:ubiquinone/menaquinone biosynthesis C-methylase UbiE
MTLHPSLPFAAVLLTAAVASAPAFALRASARQAPDAKQVAQERASAEADVPKLVAVLEIEPGMTIADVGAGFGAMTVVLASRDRSGRVIATDIGERSLGVIRDYVKREGLDNVTILEGGEASTNLPDACCDAIFLRNVYHHITDVAAFNRSLFASLKPGGRLAIIDAAPGSGSETPKGVPANREGHGIRAALVRDELAAAGFVVDRTIDKWPPDEKVPSYLVLVRKPR